MILEGSTVLVTGAASGLGRATVEHFLESGASVVASDIVPQEAIVAPDAILARHRSVKCDVTNSDSIQEAIDVATGEFGRIDVVVNCAGIYGAGKLVNRAGIPLDLADFQRVIEVNLVGTINLFRLAAARMVSQEPRDGERGVLIAVASIAGLDGAPGQAAYAASKAAVSSIMYTLALDLAPQLIRVMGIAPGAFDTKMLAGLGKRGLDMVVAKAKHPARVGDPREFAALAGQIAENQMLNGTTFRIDAAARLGG